MLITRFDCGLIGEIIVVDKGVLHKDSLTIVRPRILCFRVATIVREIQYTYVAPWLFSYRLRNKAPDAPAIFPFFAGT